MPYYEFEDKIGRTISVFQHMNDNHDFWVDDDGNKWKRVFNEAPHAVIDSVFNIDPNNRQEFVKRKGQKRGKMGDIYQLSAELSEKRKDRDGVDFVKEKNMDDYEKSRCRGTIHPNRKKTQLKEALGKLGAEIDI